jgi:hypothetical protein
LLLGELLDRYPLPAGFRGLEHFSETIAIGSSHIELSGLSVISPWGEQLTGSAAAAEPSGRVISRSYFELLERASVVMALHDRRANYERRDRVGRLAGRAGPSDLLPESTEPDRWRPSRSNGVALHLSWREACDRAAAELVERDLVLRSWYGESVPVPCQLLDEAIPEGIRSLGEWRAYEFPAGAQGICSGHKAVCVVGFPKDHTTPMAYGFAARRDGQEAVNAAAGEAAQRFGFLFGETIPCEGPSFFPGPDFHQEYFLFPPSHRLLSEWLDGTSGPLATAHAAARPNVFDEEDAEFSFVDLTPEHLRGSLSVAKALCSRAEPLVFGEPAPHRTGVSQGRRVHPIA